MLPAVDPAAVRLAELYNQPCLIHADGGVRCSTDEFMQRAAAQLTAQGPVLEISGSCARYGDGTVRCFDASTRALKARFELATAISFSPDHGDVGCVLDAAGGVWCSGHNTHGQRGIDGDLDRAGFTPVAGLPRIAALAASGEHVCARATDGTVWCWGRATEGETGEAAYAAAAATTRAACALDRPAMKRQAQRLRQARPECRRASAPEDCRPRTWIERDDCEIAYPSGPTRKVARPLQVPGVTDAIAIGVASGRSCALTRGRELVCWGAGSAKPRVVATTTE